MAKKLEHSDLKLRKNLTQVFKIVSKGTFNGDIEIRRVPVIENFKKGTFNREGYLDFNLSFLETAGYV